MLIDDNKATEHLELEKMRMEDDHEDIIQAHMNVQDLKDNWESAENRLNKHFKQRAKDLKIYKESAE